MEVGEPQWEREEARAAEAGAVGVPSRAAGVLSPAEWGWADERCERTGYLLPTKVMN